MNPLGEPFDPNAFDSNALGPDGRPQFIQTPQGYSSNQGPGQKIRFLLGEVQQLDTSTSMGRPTTSANFRSKDRALPKAMLAARVQR